MLAVLVVLLTTAFAPGPTRQPNAVRTGAAIPVTPGPTHYNGIEARLTVFPLRTSKLGDQSGTVPAVRRYTVQNGDTLASIAKGLRLQPQTLRWANPWLINNQEPQSGQMLVVPAVDGVLHVVMQGETVDSLSRAFGIEAPDLLDYNGLTSPAQVRPGARLMIPGSKPPAQANLFGGGAISYQASDYNQFPWGWCTWYVAQRRDIPWKGDAWSWYGSARAAGWATGQKPKVGAVMVTWESYFYGHVAYVEKVNGDGSFVVSEMNYKGFGEVDFRTVTPKDKIQVIGFIY
jgi:LysM repeat protein